MPNEWLTPEAKKALGKALASGACGACVSLVIDELISKNKTVTHKVQDFILTTVCTACVGVGAVGVGIGINNLKKPADQIVQQAPGQEQQAHQGFQRPAQGNQLPNRDLRQRAVARPPGRGGAFVSVEIKSREIPRNPTGSRAAGLPALFSRLNNTEL